MPEDDNTKKQETWDFSDYAFTITGIIVGVLLVAPEILESLLGISILGGSLGDIPSIGDELLGYDNGGAFGWSILELRAFSPLLFLLTTTIVMFKDAFDARKSGGYTGSLFTHTFSSLLEDAIYMAITTVMVYLAVLFGAMYASWLAGPITWILFVFIFPLVRKSDVDANEADSAGTPWLLLLIFVLGVIAEAATGAWVAFPLSWLIICVFKFVSAIRERKDVIDKIFDILYYAFSVILLAVGIVFDFWMMSWIAFPIALFIAGSQASM